MSRLLLLVVIFVAIYWLFRSYRQQVRKDRASGISGGNLSGQAEDMVRCAHCGVHLPKHEGILAEGEYYCSEAHHRARTKRPDQS